MKRIERISFTALLVALTATACESGPGQTATHSSSEATTTTTTGAGATSGAGGDAGGGGVTAGAGGNTGGGGAGECPSGAGAGGPLPDPPVCGDGVRDPATEECDDGSAGSPLCGDDCRVQDFPLPNTSYFALEGQSHSVAVGDGGFAVAFCESHIRSGIRFFSPTGTLLGEQTFYTYTTRSEPCAGLALVALPCGTYAAFWAGMEGFRMRRFAADGSFAGDLLHPEVEPVDLDPRPSAVWTGSELVVIWRYHDVFGHPGLRMRLFDENLEPLSGDTNPAVGQQGAEPVITRFNGSWAAAWYDVIGLAFPEESFTILTPAGSVTIPDVGPEQAPQLVALDSSRLLLAYVIDDGSRSFIEVAIVDPVSGALPVRVEVPAGTVQDPQVSASKPVLAVAGSRVFLSWVSTKAAEGNVLKEMTWDPASQTLEMSAPEIRLARWPENDMDIAAKLGVGPFGVDATLVAAFSGPDLALRVERLPLPILRIDP
jgi:hypothetical protein